MKIDIGAQLMALEARLDEARFVRSPEEATTRCERLKQEIGLLRGHREAEYAKGSKTAAFTEEELRACETRVRR